MSYKTKIHVLISELIRIMRNISPHVAESERQSHIQYFMNRLQFSGYSKDHRIIIYRKVKTKFAILTEVWRWFRITLETGSENEVGRSYSWIYVVTWRHVTKLKGSLWSRDKSWIQCMRRNCKILSCIYSYEYIKFISQENDHTSLGET